MLDESLIRLFGTSGIRGDLKKLSPQLAMKLGLSLATALENKGSVVVGHDVRLSSPLLANALSSGLMSGGCDAIELAFVPTPVLAFTTRRRKSNAGVMVTGSHNPPSDNGLKCYTGEGREYTSDEEEPIESLMLNESYRLASWEKIGSKIPLEDALNEYCETLLGSVEPTRRQIHIVVDCANSVGAKVTPRLLSALGCRVTALNANLDGTFSSRPPEPTPETLARTSQIAVAVHADLTIAHDSDADRISILDEHGHYVTNDRILAFFASLLLTKYGPGTVVTSIDTSLRIDEVVAKHGGTVKRTRLGKTHELLKRDAGDIRLCCEPSKIIDSSWGYWGDGVHAACQLASALASADGSISELLKEIPDYPQSRTSYSCPDERKAQTMKTVETALSTERDVESVWNYDGVRVNYHDGSWILVRSSGTEPKIRAYCEARTQARLDELVRKTSSLIIDSMKTM